MYNLYARVSLCIDAPLRPAGLHFSLCICVHVALCTSLSWLRVSRIDGFNVYVFEGLFHGPLTAELWSLCVCVWYGFLCRVIGPTATRFSVCEQDFACVRCCAMAWGVVLWRAWRGCFAGEWMPSGCSDRL